jgi:hypothetical protein
LSGDCARRARCGLLPVSAMSRQRQSGSSLCRSPFRAYHAAGLQPLIISRHGSKDPTAPARSIGEGDRWGSDDMASARDSGIQARGETSTPRRRGSTPARFRARQRFCSAWVFQYGRSFHGYTARRCQDGEADLKVTTTFPLYPRERPHLSTRQEPFDAANRTRSPGDGLRLCPPVSDINKSLLKSVGLLPSR